MTDQEYIEKALYTSLHSTMDLKVALDRLGRPDLFQQAVGNLEQKLLK